MPITDLTNTIWLFNDTVDLEDAETTGFGLNFKSNNVTYDTFSFSPGRTSTFIYYSVSPDRTQVYSTSTGWANTNYKAISITGGSDATNSHLISWLTNNATLLPSDLTGYTWVANNSLNLPYSNITFSNIIFTSNSLQYSSIVFFADLQEDLDDDEYYELWFSYDNTWVYNYVDGTSLIPSSEAWSNNNFKTIQFIGGQDATNSTLIAWLEANGTLTAPQPVVTPNISIGNLSLAKSFIGNVEVSKIFFGNVKLYEKQ